VPIAQVRRETPWFQVREALLHPLFLLALSMLVVNDHVLKGAGILPSALTGKLSDFAGLVVAPTVLAVLLRARSRRIIWGCHLAVGATFAAINVSPGAAHVVEWLTSQLGIGWHIWVDPTDLLALPALALSARYLVPAGVGHATGLRSAWRRALTAAALATGLCATAASSQMRASQPTVLKGQVFVQGWYGDPIFAVDIETGRPTARLEIAAAVDIPVVRDGIVYVADNGEVAAYELSTARQVWAHERPDDGYRMQPLVADEDRVYLHFLPSTSLGGLDWEDRQLEALDRATGRSLWQVPAIGGARTPVIVDDRILVTSGEQLSAVAAKDGRTLWTFTSPAAIGLPVAGEKHVYIGDADGTLHTLDASNGREVSHERLGDDHSFMDHYYFNEPPLQLFDGSLYFVVDHQLVVLDETTREPVWSAPDVNGAVVGEGVALGRTGDGWYVAFDAKTGRKMWRVQIHDSVLGRPVIHHGVVCIRPQASVLYGFDLRSGALRWTLNLQDGTRVTPTETALLLH